MSKDLIQAAGQHFALPAQVALVLFNVTEWHYSDVHWIFVPRLLRIYNDYDLMLLCLQIKRRQPLPKLNFEGQFELNARNKR